MQYIKELTLCATSRLSIYECVISIFEANWHWNDDNVIVMSQKIKIGNFLTEIQKVVLIFTQLFVGMLTAM